jgi:hypothetical protein
MTAQGMNILSTGVTKSRRKESGVTKAIKKRVYNDMIVRKLKRINQRRMSKVGKGYGSKRFKQKIKVWTWMWFRNAKRDKGHGEVKRD